jgi:hypothetical protein
MNIRLYEKLPDGVTVDGRFIACDFDFRNVLKMLDVMQHEDIYPDARDFLCVKCVARHPHRIKNASEVYKAIGELLFEKTPDSGGERITSFEQDASMIRTAFRQVYNIDLFRDKLTWFEFTELLHNLPEGNKYSDVLGIRARPMPAPTKYNQKEREWLMDAKRRFRIHLTEAEASKKYDHDVMNIFTGLMSMIPKDGENKNGE